MDCEDWQISIIRLSLMNDFDSINKLLNNYIEFGTVINRKERKGKSQSSQKKLFFKFSYIYLL